MTVILTDCDGVLLNWEYAFNTWMERHGYERTFGHALKYDVCEKYNIPKPKAKELVKFFNESAAIGFLPPLRDAIHYVQKLHREHGYVFHVITSMSTEPAAQDLRIQNLNKIFGESVFEKFVFLDTGADKDEELAKYKDSGLLWIEDKIENAECGRRFGLESIVMEHAYNMDDNQFLLMRNWKDVYNYVVGD